MSDILQNKFYTVLGDGARSAKFRTQILVPDELLGDFKGSDLDFITKSASFPSFEVQTTDIKFKGRSIPIPGIQEYSKKATFTFYNDENHTIRKVFLDWMNRSQTHRFDNSIQLDPKFISVHLFQLNYELDKDTVAYSLFNAFPTSVSEIDVSSDTQSEVETFTVDFSYSHFSVNQISGVGLTSDDIAQQLKNAAQSIANTFVKQVKNVVGGAVDALIGKALDFIGLQDPYNSMDDFIQV